MDFTKLSQGERIVLIAGILLIVDLLLFPWHKFPGLLGVPPYGPSSTGIQSPGAAWGVIALLVTLAMVAHLVATRLANVTLPDIPLPWGQVHLIAGCTVFGLLLIKLVAETDFTAYGAYLGVMLAAALAFGGFVVNKEATATGRGPL